MTVLKDYTAHLDSKKRITIRGALYQFYNVKEYKNGCVLLEPRELTVPDSISAKTLKQMDKAIENFNIGKVSEEIDLSDFWKIIFMNFKIKMGIPEVLEYWNYLQERYRNKNINKKEERIYKKWGKALKLLSENPNYPSLNTHEISQLSRRYKLKVWQSYLENKTSKAMRMYWVYGPNKNDITIIGLEPHPEDKKKGAYDTINLSNLPLD